MRYYTTVLASEFFSLFLFWTQKYYVYIYTFFQKSQIIFSFNFPKIFYLLIFEQRISFLQAGSDAFLRSTSISTFRCSSMGKRNPIFLFLSKSYPIRFSSAIEWRWKWRAILVSTTRFCFVLLSTRTRPSTLGRWSESSCPISSAVVGFIGFNDFFLLRWMMNILKERLFASHSTIFLLNY